MQELVDIHCHLAFGLDDGARDRDESLAMARQAVDDGIGVIVATPHQLGGFLQNNGELIRDRVGQLQELLHEHGAALTVLPGADVRIEPKMISRIRSGDVLTLADQGKHVLLELPHELYIPMEKLLAEMAAAKLVGVLSHPERNQGILAQPAVVPPLVAAGCLMQITADSLMGRFGSRSRQFCEWMLEERLVHFIATDAHGPSARRPILSEAFRRAAQLAGEEYARELCVVNGRLVVEGKDIVSQSRGAVGRRLRGWLNWRRAG